MKKFLVRSFMVLLFLLIAAAIAVHFFLDAAIKKGVETVGPELTKVTVRLDSASISLLSGAGSLKGLVVGNPEGFKTPSAISVGIASLAVKPGSLLSDKIIIESINVQAPEITFETDLRANNLKKILANVEASAGSDPKAPAADKDKAAKPAKKLQVNDFAISGGKIRVSVTAMGGKAATVPLPTIHLQNLGSGPEGITPAELTGLVLQAIESSAAKASADVVADISKGAAVVTKQFGNPCRTPP